MFLDIIRFIFALGMAILFSSFCVVSIENLFIAIKNKKRKSSDILLTAMGLFLFVICALMYVNIIINIICGWVGV